MRDRIQVTTLMDNSVHRRGLKAEHGLSFHLRSGPRQLLFDTGQTDLLMHNASELGLPLEGLDAVVLSHGHYDHTGGLVAVRRVAPQARLFLHPAALASKFAGDPNEPARPVGIPSAGLQSIQQAGDSVVWTTACTEVMDGIFATGKIPRATSFEDVGGRFFLDEKCQQPDPLADDQALFFESSDGLVVLFGCGHAGVVNTLRHVEQLTGARRMTAVLGGFHLLAASRERMAETVEALRRREIRYLVPAHCTGWLATMRLWQDFPGRCLLGGVGGRFVFDR